MGYGPTGGWPTYDSWRPKIMPVDGPPYLVGRTDARVLTMMFCEGTKKRCLWTLPNGFRCVLSYLLSRFLSKSLLPNIPQLQ